MIVPAGYVGVVRFLGQVQPNVLYPGASWVMPFANEVEEVDTRVQPHNFQQLTAATAENLQVTVTGTMNYHLDPAFAGTLIQNVGSDFASKIIDPAFSDYIKQVVPAYSADSSATFILNKRDEIRQLTKQQLGDNLARYHIIVDDIYIVDIGYPQAYNDSITSKQVEQQNVQREQQILEQKRIQAQQIVVTAQGQADANRATAAGQADANQSITSSLTDELIRWQAIQKLNPNVQIMLLPEGNQCMFPLPSPPERRADAVRCTAPARGRADRDQPVRARRRIQPGGDRDRHRHAVRRVADGDARRARLDAQADRQHPSPLGSHRRQRGGHGRDRRALAAHIADRHGLVQPVGAIAPFPIPPSVPAVDLAEGSRIHFGEIDLEVLHTPGHTEGSVCLRARGEPAVHRRHPLRRQLGADRPDRWLGGADGRVAHPAWRSCRRPARPARPRPQSTIGAEKAWLEQVARTRALPY